MTRPAPDGEPARPHPERVIVGVSGASGAPYALRLIEALLASPDLEVHAIVTPAGWRVVSSETDPVAPHVAGRPPIEAHLRISPEQRDRLKTHACGDIGAGPASGTYPVRAMIVCPCSMNTLAAVAHGMAGNLLTRAASVMLKEGRSLILVPRETPFTLVDLRNMTAAAEAGAVILPANPGFYHRPANVEAVVDYVVQKIMDRLGLDYGPGAVRWGRER